MDTNTLAPMYVVTPEGATFMEALRVLLDCELITVAEYEKNVIDARLRFRPESSGKSCDNCCAIADWRYIDMPWAEAHREVGNWGYLCPSCATTEMVANYRVTTRNKPWVMEPIGDGVYEPDIAIVMMAQLR